MKKQIAKLMAVFITISLFVTMLSGCGSSKTKLYVYNCGLYIDKEVIKIFEKENPDIKIVYETYETNEAMYAKVKAGGSSYDVVFPSDYMIQKMIAEDMLAKIDTSALSNYSKIGDEFKNLEYDPTNEYSVPYFWGTVGIIYNKTMVSETVDSWDILWNEKYSKKIFMLDSSRDSIAVALLKLGYDINTKDEKELNQAKELLIKQKPLVLQYVVDQLTKKMVSGEGALGVCWSGDAINMIEQNSDLEYVVPKEGSNIWYDAMCILKTSKHQAEAAKFIDFMCRTDIAKMNTEEVYYSTPQTETLSQLDDFFKKSSVYNPSDEIKARCKAFTDLSKMQQAYSDLWNEVGVA